MQPTVKSVLCALIIMMGVAGYSVANASADTDFDNGECTTPLAQK